MEDIDENFIRKKMLLMKINSDELNKKLLYYINEARTYPKDFSRHLMINDDVDEKISKLSLFFKYSSEEVPSLILDSNLGKTSQELLYHIISIDDGSSPLKFNREEKERNCLIERLKRLNLKPGYHIDLLIIGVDNSIEALSDLLVIKSHRKKILSPEMKYIGIASGLLPSERLCFVIDIVSSFQIYDNYIYPRIKYSNFNKRPSNFNYGYKKYQKYDEDAKFVNNDEEEEFYNSKNNTYINNNEMIYNKFNPKYNSEMKKFNNKSIFNSVYFPSQLFKENDSYEDNRTKNNLKNKKNEEIIDLRISQQKCLRPSNGSNGIYAKKQILYQPPKKFKIPVSVSIEKKYAKNKVGEFFPIYSRETKYDDGSILIQPYIDENNDDI